MGKFGTLKYYWRTIRHNWKTKYRLVIRNVLTHQDKISILLSPKNIFVLVTTSALLLIFLTIFLIAFTPLRVYVPGYTNPGDYQVYKEVALKMDSLDKRVRITKDYLDQFHYILSEEIVVEDEKVEEMNRKIEEKEQRGKGETETYRKAKERLNEESEMILHGYPDDQQAGKTVIPLTKRADINTLYLFSPTYGVVIKEYNPASRQFGIGVKNHKNTLVSSVLEGVVICSGFDPVDGNTLVIQHPGNLISIYKHNEVLLKTKGQNVKSGETIARMGNSGSTSDETYLYFELWYNGYPVNPLEYIVIN